MKKFSKKIVLCGMTALLAAALMSCKDDDGPTPPPPTDRPSWLLEDAEFPFPGEEYEYEVGELSGNLIDNGDADGGEAETGAVEYKAESGCTVEYVDGGVSGKCCLVKQGGTGSWQEFYYDVTKFYGQGKSYLLSFDVKANPDAALVTDALGAAGKSNEQPLSVSYAVYSGDVKDWANRTGNEHYDFDDEGKPTGYWKKPIVSPWGGPFSTSEYFTEALKDKGVEVELAGDVPLVTENWTHYDYVISTEDIESIINNTGLYVMQVAFSMGPQAVGGYSYMLDNITFRDLNIEVERLGQTAFATTGEEEGGEGAE